MQWIYYDTPAYEAVLGGQSYARPPNTGRFQVLIPLRPSDKGFDNF